MIRLLLVLALLASGPAAAQASAGAVEVRVGLLGFRGAERAVSDWEPTLRHLEAALPGHVFSGVVFDLPGMGAAVAAGEVAFVITNPGHYAELEAAHGVTRIATVETVADDRGGGPKPAAAIGSAVVVRAAREDLRTFADLKGRRIAAVLPQAFGGFRVAWRELAAAGVDPFADAEMRFLGFPMEGIVAAVASGEADAGIVRTCLLEQMAAEGAIRLDDFRVLAPRDTGTLPCRSSTPLYPDWPFAKLAATPDALAKQVGMALLSMPASAGHAWTVPVDYQPVHELFRALKIGPYAALAERSFAQMLRDYWPWLALAGLGLGWWVVHAARVEVLVRRRTEELRAAHAEARRARQDQEHAARLALLGEMASSLAHEINQPLAAIANYANGCERRIRAGADPAGVAEGVRLIAGQAERAAAIIKRVRSFVGKRTGEVAPLDLSETVRAALDLFRDAGARRDMVLDTSLAPDLPAARGDRLQLELVVLNLLQNAADATAGQPHRHLSVTTRAVPDGLEVAVADNGPGLAPEARHRLFEPFFTTKPHGMGLGLSLSRSILEAHGGRLWVEDAPGGGACFRFILPGPPPP
ncbi:PhnD/SsuA/transferrin family substrate-binding protein [Novispirillum sp. DQ9]|uniref:sensor histidine kinase n=1 Tax=Novispirillum sp. DQ9 TaxID=3398612 RepID=UPI003C7C0F2E